MLRDQVWESVWKAAGAGGKNDVVLSPTADGHSCRLMRPRGSWQLEGVIDGFPSILRAHGLAADGFLSFFCPRLLPLLSSPPLFFSSRSPLNAVTGRATGTHAFCCSPSRRRLFFFTTPLDHSREGRGRGRRCHFSTSCHPSNGKSVRRSNAFNREERSNTIQPPGRAYAGATPSTSRSSVRRPMIFNILGQQLRHPSTRQVWEGLQSVDEKSLDFSGGSTYLDQSFRLTCLKWRNHFPPPCESCDSAL